MNETTSQDSENREIKPLFAGVLGLLVPGMGQVYTGRLRLGIRWFVAYAIATMVLGIAVFPISFVGGLTWVVIIYGIRIATLIEAIVFAARHRIAARRPYNRANYHLGIVILGYLILLGCVRPIRWFGAEAFRLPTGTMENTMLVGDFLMVSKRPGYVPQSGDVIIFNYPLDPRLAYVKRCVALPGQTVEIRSRQVYVDGAAVSFPPEAKFTSTQPLAQGVPERGIFRPDTAAKWNHDHWGPMVVPANKYFVLGDNRDNSSDSRYWGFVPQDHVRGKAGYIYFSYDKRVGGIGAIRWSRIGMNIK